MLQWSCLLQLFRCGEIGSSATQKEMDSCQHWLSRRARGHSVSGARPPASERERENGEEEEELDSDERAMGERE